MDFNDTSEEAAFRAEARAWLEANAERLKAGERAPGLAEGRADQELIQRSQQWQAKKADAGWACITWPKEYGGRGASAIQSVIWNQEESHYKIPPNIFGIGQGMLGPTIMVHGSSEQKQRYLRPMLRGDEIWCQLFSEPGAGSDLGGLRTSAVREGDQWVINGQKIWTTGAQYCRWGMILCRTDPGAEKHKGITYFIVDMKSPGIDIRPIKQINGLSGFNEVFFTDVRVSDDNRVGAVNEGWRGALTTLMNERHSIGGGAGGPDFGDLLQLAKETLWEGRPAFADSAVRQRLARFYIRLKGLQYTGYRTQTALSRGAIPGPESSIGKLVGAPLRQEMASFAVDLQGAAGVAMDGAASADDGLWQLMYLATPGLRLAGGTDEILRNIIAERVLGLPPEIRADKGMAFKDVPTGPKNT
ncbi:MAG: acyl-CoA dehydrogenase family protein [Deltaproteobacteria bacterium]|nr:acyl-CoA dehydrogenase family protein [Deltaproteobacteria bacterium]